MRLEPTVCPSYFGLIYAILVQVTDFSYLQDPPKIVVLSVGSLREMFKSSIGLSKLARRI